MMTELSRHLEMCVKDPFGPFLDSDVLSPKCTFFESRPVVLRGFTMACAGRIIGCVKLSLSFVAIAIKPPGSTRRNSALPIPLPVFNVTLFISKVSWRLRLWTGFPFVGRNWWKRTYVGGILRNESAMFPVAAISHLRKSIAKIPFL